MNLLVQLYDIPSTQDTENIQQQAQTPLKRKQDEIQNNNYEHLNKRPHLSNTF